MEASQGCYFIKMGGKNIGIRHRLVVRSLKVKSGFVGCGRVCRKFPVISLQKGNGSENGRRSRKVHHLATSENLGMRFTHVDGMSRDTIVNILKF